ncbi:alanine--tRNA ligase [Celerinatantimonas diazotrophica]|uniref:Alanine--tRNA ligase n=1 Tax=Celerinatantimonas diazotrophica TaxID=412034 RepID=A0A4R1JAU5_9GAMM|nr:alanine--tRNA ligase [Celerinatantimonas diazotrophica]TCK47219.1 alanyl-tRNA synthetase [Celerinatantimonas diazotrophica]CAG9295991.1 Alanine--tRNA ligase [Celerinatantimonas diazotrophica]
MKMTSAEIRTAFLEYYQQRGHQIVPSSSLVPHNDPTLLFTNAGMNQFKDIFLGLEKRNYSRAVTAQRCVRAGGKHNDLDNVGYTARHHTFFEMMGNFSFGDYFKRDAIHFAWGFLTEVLGLPQEKLLVTVYAEDDEAFGIWNKDIGLPEEKIVRIGDNKGERFASDNFWQMGDTGPCGPCSEIFYDHGEDVAGGPPGSPEEDGDRFIEIWNLVFMQFNRQSDGQMQPLPKPSVDTGMGLERMAAIMQGVHSNYEIDIFQDLIHSAARVIGTTDLLAKSLCVIADHIRSCSFLIVDGVMPSNEGRGYVLRRIIRRAVRHGNKLGCREIFFYKLVSDLVRIMGDAYPEIKSQQEIIEKVLRLEEEQFAKTLDRGLQILDEELSELKEKVIPGDVVFKLYDTYGFPDDLTADVARERGFSVDHEGFEAAMKKQRQQAKQASQFSVDYSKSLQINETSEFIGYHQLESDAKVVALFADGEPVTSAQSECLVVLDKTPFYAESGGQAGDTGSMSFAHGQLSVGDTTKIGDAIVHHAVVTEGSLNVGMSVHVSVDSRKRQATALNHSVTHLLHAALRQVLGDHVAQKGSLVEAQRLRFDFSHLEAIDAQTLEKIEHLVNANIRANLPVSTTIMGLEDAKQAGAMALFGEKYGDEVRVVKMGEFSTELCGGTHVHNTGEIGLFKIIHETGIAAGVRRIEATSGQFALDYVQKMQQQLSAAASELKGDQFSLVSRIVQHQEHTRALEKELAQLKDKLAAQAGANIIDQVEVINGVKVLIADLAGVEAKSLRTTLDDLKVKLNSAVIVLGTASEDKVNLIAGVTKDLTGKVKAGDLVNVAAAVVGGRGGGRPDMAQAGGSEPKQLPQALAAAKAWLAENL